MEVVDPNTTAEGQGQNDVTSSAAQPTYNDDDTTCRVRARRCITKLPPLQVIITLVACFMVDFVLSITYTTGNLLPYLTSYLRNVTGETSLDYSTTLWVDNCTWLVVFLAIPVFGLIQRRMSNRLYMFMGVVAFAVSFVCGYWVVQESFIMMVFVCSGFLGISQAILWPLAVSTAIMWFPERKGFVGALVMTGYGAGAFAWNQMVTQWINPLNLQPDVTVGEDLYFSQPEVLDNVPSYYLLVGGVLSGILLLCLFGITFPPQHDDDKTHIEVKSPLPAPDKTASVTDTRTISGQLSEAQEDTNFIDTPATDIVDKDSWVPRSDDVHDYRPVEVITSRAAWTIWCINFFTEMAFGLAWAFWKAYGQTFIHDDHFLALVGSFASVFNSVGRPFFGLLADKIGYQPTFMICQGVLTLALATFFLSEQAGSAMFFIWVGMMYLAISGFYALQGPLVMALFGSRYFTFTIGIVFSSGMIYYLISVFVVAAIKDVFGWHGIFFLAAASAFLGFLLTTSFFFDCGHPIPAHMKRALLKRRQKHRIGEST